MGSKKSCWVFVQDANLNKKAGELLFSCFLLLTDDQLVFVHLFTSGFQRVFHQ